jgi:hypothetical protein
MKLIFLALTLISLHVDPNPGHLDNPSCVRLVKKVLTDNDIPLSNVTIEYYGTGRSPDGKGASNTYIVRNKDIPQQGIKITVAVLWEAFTPSPNPAPTPTPTPAGFRIEA